MSVEAASSALDKSDLENLNNLAVEEPNEEAFEEDIFDPESYYKAERGDFISFRYRIIKKLGEGQFSNVWLCRDLSESKLVAAKIIRNKYFYKSCALHEINMIKKIQNSDPTDPYSEKISYLSDYFTIPAMVCNHVCLVFPTIGKDLLAFMRDNCMDGAPIHHVKSIIRQVLEGVHYMHSKCGVIHTDLKPENILICLDNDDVSEMANNPLFGSGIEVSFPSNAQDNLSDNKYNEGNNLEMGRIYPDLSQVADPSDGGSSQEMMQLTDRAEALGLNYCSGAIKTANVEGEIRIEDDKKIVTEDVKNKNEGCSTGTDKYPSSLTTMRSVVNLNIFAGKEIKVKITDFGNSCTILEHLSQRIQTRHYRSPEILMGADYGTSVDIWSVGCIAFELATGNILFNPPSVEGYSKDEIHIAVMMQLLGDIPKTVRDRGALSSSYFLESGELINIDTSRRYTLAQKLSRIHNWQTEMAEQFSDFLLIMLKFDPLERATAAECLQHPWLKI